MLSSLLVSLLLVVPSSGQQLYELVSSNQTTKAGLALIEPSYSFSDFKYTQSTTYRYAESIPSPTTTHTFAKPLAQLASLIGNVSTTTWGNWNPHPAPTDRPSDSSDPYGQAAWTALWESASIQDYTWGIYSTTVKPTPVPTSELVLPPGDQFTFANENLTFPDGFMFGVAGSAAQIEGAAAEEGRAPTILEKHADGTDLATNYVTNEHYYLYKQDIARLAAMGVKYYSFSIPMSRILPFGITGSPVNKQGIDHYDDVINTVLEYGMLPMVTMSHFDIPLTFITNFTRATSPTGSSTVSGGPPSGVANETFVDAFVNYGKILLTHFSDRVPVWVSFNEPNVDANPFSIQHVIQAHSQLYHFYKDEIKGTGKFGIKFGALYCAPLDPRNKTDIQAAERYQDFMIAVLANPIFLGKNYPDVYSQTLGVNLTAEDLKLAANTSDFLGVDPYTTITLTSPPGGIDACVKNTSHPLWPSCVVQGETDIHGWAVGYRSQSYVYITPTYLRAFLNYLWNTFKTPIFTTEFGFPEWREREKELQDQLFDVDRSIYYRSFMSAILESIHYDNVNVIGALAWSFSDNWEFGDYSQQFGMQVVNRTTQARYYKKSFFDFVDFFRQRSPWY